MHQSLYFEKAFKPTQMTIDHASENRIFPASVAMFGMSLKNSDYIQDINYNNILLLAQSSRTIDNNGHKAESIRSVKSYW
jgi:Ca-activated chloride channel family protein